MKPNTRKKLRTHELYTLKSNKQFILYLLGSFLSAVIGFLSMSIQHLIYTLNLPNVSNTDVLKKTELMSYWDVILIVFFVLFSVLAYIEVQKEKVAHTIEKKDIQIESLELTIKNTGMSLYKYMSRLINESLNNVLQELAEAVTENIDNIVSVSISKYSVTYNKEDIVYDIVHEAAFSRHNIRSMYIGREIYKIDKLLLAELNILLTENDNLEIRISDIIDKEVSVLKKEYMQSGDEVPSNSVLEEIATSRLDLTEFSQEYDRILEKVDEKVKYLKFILEHKLEFNGFFEFWMPRSVTDLTYRDCSLRIIINSYLSLLTSYSREPINEELDQLLRRKQRTSIMTSIIIGQSSYDLHRGISDKNGRIYVFYPFEFNLGKYVASFSLAHESLCSYDNLDDPEILEKMSNDVILSFDKYLNKIAHEYSLEVSENNAVE